ncbi:MAG: hypothetical protein R2879_09810 [Saprospiraceae bacterium]
MVSASEVISMINKFSLKERLRIVEEILRGIRNEDVVIDTETEKKDYPKPKILELAGILSEDEAADYEKAVEDSRKIDKDDHRSQIA